MEQLNIRHFKLMNGEEIIGLLAHSNEDNLIIERPVRLNPSLLGGTQFSSWFPFSESKQFKVLKTAIIQHVPIAESIKDTYVNFALKMDQPISMPQTKTDEELFDEYERSLNTDHADDMPEDSAKDRILH
jgi:hypothetical protein|tara:strand:- start:10611 stop:11000 length:390 start_codon:yes stop_codon:yes gene_type:complete